MNTWPWLGGRRVLIEHPDALSALATAARLRRAGYPVAICHGPNESWRCPLVDGDECAIAAGADVVVSALGTAGVEVVAAHGLRHPEIPIVSASDPLDAESVLTVLRAPNEEER